MRELHSAIGGAICWALGVAGGVLAEEPLIANRPGFSNVWEVVDRGDVELNAGLQLTRLDESEALSFGQVLIRTGLTERLELRVGLNSYLDVEAPAGDASGWEDPTLGLKVKLVEGFGRVGGARPEAALVVQSTLPVGSSALPASEAQPAALLVLSWDPGERVHLDTNYGVAYLDLEEDRLAEGFLSSAFSIGLIGDLGAYLEYAGFFPLESGFDDAHFVFAALTYLPSPRSQLDLGVGQGLNGLDREYFVSAGVAYRW